jgi:hypothetical protein
MIGRSAGRRICASSRSHGSERSPREKAWQRSREWLLHTLHGRWSAMPCEWMRSGRTQAGPASHFKTNNCHEEVREIEVAGLGAPVFFHRPLTAPLEGGPGGVFVSWKIVRKTATEATVEISDWVAAMAAGGQEVFLQRLDGEWVVVARLTTWIS